MDALKRDFKRLSKIADKARNECDEAIGVGSEIIAIHEELALIVKSKDHGPATIKKLEVLKQRSERAEKSGRKT